MTDEVINEVINKGEIEIFASSTGAEIKVKLDNETVWLSQAQMSDLFNKNKRTISEHINNVFKEGELERDPTVRKFRTVQIEGEREVTRNVEYYNLDVIISIGYRVKSQQGTQFRIWATQRLKDYLVQGYSINEKRLAQKQQEVQHLKTGIRILSRAIEDKVDEVENGSNLMLRAFAKGLALLDDYDHEALDVKGQTESHANYPEVVNYLGLIDDMQSDFESDVFAKPKDESFESSVNQIRQSFDGKDLYPSIEEKAATLLYLVVKNHSFVDGNKRIAAACFLYFLEQNQLLFDDNNNPIISNEALASLTLFIASSKSDESDTVKKLIVSILNRSHSL